MVKGHIASILCSIDSKLHDLHCECYSIVEKKKNKQKKVLEVSIKCTARSDVMY